MSKARLAELQQAAQQAAAPLPGTKVSIAFGRCDEVVCTVRLASSSVGSRFGKHVSTDDVRRFVAAAIAGRSMP
jgi:hypothetical protein